MKEWDGRDAKKQDLNRDGTHEVNIIGVGRAAVRRAESLAFQTLGLPERALSKN